MIRVNKTKAITSRQFKEIEQETNSEKQYVEALKI